MKFLQLIKLKSFLNREILTLINKNVKLLKEYGIVVSVQDGFGSVKFVKEINKNTTFKTNLGYKFSLLSGIFVIPKNVEPIKIRFKYGYSFLTEMPFLEKVEASKEITNICGIKPLNDKIPSHAVDVVHDPRNKVFGVYAWTTFKEEDSSLLPKHIIGYKKNGEKQGIVSNGHFSIHSDSKFQEIREIFTKHPYLEERELNENSVIDQIYLNKTSGYHNEKVQDLLYESGVIDENLIGKLNKCSSQKDYLHLTTAIQNQFLFPFFTDPFNINHLIAGKTFLNDFLTTLQSKRPSIDFGNKEYNQLHFKVTTYSEVFDKLIEGFNSGNPVIIKHFSETELNVKAPLVNEEAKFSLFNIQKSKGVPYSKTLFDIESSKSSYMGSDRLSNLSLCSKRHNLGLAEPNPVLNLQFLRSLSDLFR